MTDPVNCGLSSPEGALNVARTVPAEMTFPDGPEAAGKPRPVQPAVRPAEIGGRSGPEPTRYGDWELRGRCIDF